MAQALRATERRRAAVWVAIILLGAWMLFPILTPVHVEGFSASIVSLALHLNAGQLADYDHLHPANLEYFTLSRLGTVAFVSILTGSLHLSGDWSIRLTTWLGFAMLATSSFVLVRRWTNASGMATVVALLLIPGLAENSFFYNDTIFAAGLGTTALAVIGTSPTTAGAAISGVLLGAAIVSRLDAVLLAPAVVLIGYEQHGLGRAFWNRAVVYALCLLLPVVAVPAALHATIMDVYSTTKYAVSLWGESFRPVQHARELSFFLGLPAAVLIALGCLGLSRRRDHARTMLLVGVPTLFNLVALGKIWQSRQLLPLTPFLAALLVIGWRHISEPREGERGSALEWTVIALSCFAWFAPIVVVRVSDGPRAPYGRLWTPMLWRRWQQAVDANQVEIRALVEDPRTDSTAIITDTWDADRYLHLALQERGYREITSSSEGEACRKTAEIFAKSDRRILHLRLHQPFLPNWPQLALARLEMWAIPCIAGWRPSRLVRLAPFEQLWWSETERADSGVEALRSRSFATFSKTRYNPQLSVDLPPSDLDALHRGYQKQVVYLESRSGDRHWRAERLDDAERLMAARVWKAPSGAP
jgi:hypothetical protein